MDKANIEFNKLFNSGETLSSYDPIKITKNLEQNKVIDAACGE